MGWAVPQSGQLIDGKTIAKKVRAEVKEKVIALQAKLGTTPHLAVVLASDDPASAVYVRNKGKAAAEAGIRSTQHTLPADTSPQALLSLVQQLNDDEDIDGILVQLPLPKQHDEAAVINSIAPEKDVDGLHPINAGKLSRGDESGLIPCTPLGCIRLLEESGCQIKGKRAVVLGRSRLVGRPVADLLLNRHATVTVCHSRTQEIEREIAHADIVIAAVGREEFVKGHDIKFGATVIDVGINRNEAGKLVGDVFFLAAKERARAITPVPGGVGPMTIAHLLSNTLTAAERRRKLSRTPLYEAHKRAGARLVPFAGYEMPVQYTGVVDEHKAVREQVGLFDVSHMGEVEFTGERALQVANRIVTNDLTAIEDGQACYTVMCRPEGGIIDDLVVYRFSPQRIFICVNAANRQKDFAWMKAQAGGECEVTDHSDAYAQIAVQGPKARELVARLGDAERIMKIGRFRFVTGQVAGKEAIIARTGYTGEDGLELYVAAQDAEAIWDALLEKGQDLGVKPAGLGARDSLRLEARLHLYGNDMDETTNPYEAGLGWVVKLGKSDFVGKAALEAIKAEGTSQKLVGFEMVGRGIARQGYPVLQDQKQVGRVTSGTKGPSVGKAIGIAYVPKELSAVGSPLQIEIRGKPVEAIVVKTPFYKKG